MWQFEQHVSANSLMHVTKLRETTSQIGVRMDETDQRLISILRHDGRRSISDLAVELKISRGTVRA